MGDASSTPVEAGVNTSEFRLLAASLIWGVLGGFFAKHGVTQADVTQLSVVVAPLAASVYAIVRTIRKRAK